MSGQKNMIAVLQHSNFTIVYADVCQLLEGDITSALLMSRFIALQEHFMETGQLYEGEWFYQSVEPIEKELGIKAYQQRKSMEYLKSCGYLDYGQLGFPKKRYIRLHMDIFLGDLTGVRTHNQSVFSEEAKREFYDRLNKAWELQEFGAALDRIPGDIGEFMYAWTHAYRHCQGRQWDENVPVEKLKGWKWTARDFGMLKQFWNSFYRRIRLFDYAKLETFFLGSTSEKPPTIGGFIAWDKETPDKMIATSLRNHLKRTTSIFV